MTTNNAMGTSYAVSKNALSAMTVKLANELKSDAFFVNDVCPNFTATFKVGVKMRQEMKRNIVERIISPKLVETRRSRGKAGGIEPACDLMGR